MISITVLPAKVRLRSGEIATITSIGQTCPEAPFWFSGYTGPGTNREWYQVWMEDGSYHEDHTPSQLDIVVVL